MAYELNKFFFEIIISKGFKKDALKILKKRKKIRLIDSNKFNLNNSKQYLFLGNSFLAQDADNILLDDNGEVITTTSDIVWSHVIDGEIPFSGNFIKLGYKVISFDKIHDCIGRVSTSLTKLEKYKTWKYNKGMSCRGGGWPIELNGEIFCSPTYNLFNNHPGGVYMSDFEIDESILRTVLDWKVYISEKELLGV